MQIASINTLFILRGASSKGAGAGTSASRLALLNSGQTEDTNRRQAYSPADAARKRAARKIAELQTQLRMLQGGGLSPQATARLAAELVNKIAAASAEYAGAAASGTAAMPQATSLQEAQPEASDNEIAASALPADPDPAPPPGATSKASQSSNAAAVQSAYADIVKDGQDSDSASEDQAILEKFRALLQQAQALAQASGRPQQFADATTGSNARGFVASYPSTIIV